MIDKQLSVVVTPIIAVRVIADSCFAVCVQEVLLISISKYVLFLNILQFPWYLVPLQGTLIKKAASASFTSWKWGSEMMWITLMVSEIIVRVLAVFDQEIFNG